MQNSKVITLPKMKGRLSSSSIPAHVERVDASECIIKELEAGVIANTVTHLYLRTLTRSMVIPASVKHLFVFDFKQHMITFVPVTVTHLYLHVADRKEGPADRIHYLFRSGAYAYKIYSEDGKYNLDEGSYDHSFDTSRFVIKRTPKQLVPPALVQDLITVGETYQELIIDDSVTDILCIPTFTGLIRPGSIPTRITQVDMKNCSMDELEPGVISDSVTHLYLGT